MVALSAFDKALLNLLQSDIPICSHPFAALADQLCTDEHTVINRLRELKAAGCLRRIGTFFNSDSLGYHGVLVALAVEPTAVESVAKFINSCSGITHNYEREGAFNLWFTLLTPSVEVERKILDDIAALPGVVDMIRLKSNKKYKVNVQFKL